MQYFHVVRSVSSAVKKSHYSRRNPVHQSRSIIFLKNHYCREHRSIGMMISSDLITSGTKPDNGQWFLVLYVSVCQIHDGTKMVLMNSKIHNFSFGTPPVKCGSHFFFFFCACERNHLQVLGHISHEWRTVWRSNQMLLIFILIIINRHHTRNMFLLDNSHRWVIRWRALKSMLFFHQLMLNLPVWKEDCNHRPFRAVTHNW